MPGDSAARNYINLLSNNVFLGRLQTEKELQALLDCRLDGHLLLDVMHELTHHQSLLSPVGHALVLLRFGAQRSGWVMNETPQQFFVNQFADRILRSEAAEMALQPLAEGLAVFAQYDCYPGRDEPHSLAMLVTELLGTAFYGDALTGDFLRTKLRLARESLAEQKASLLSSRFDTSDGGYLLGYALIRHYWRLAARQDSFFADADKFLSYCIGVVYGDLRQVIHILEVSGERDFSPAKYAAAIAQTAVASLDRFFDDPQLPALRRDAMQSATRVGKTVGGVKLHGISSVPVDGDLPNTMGIFSDTEVHRASAVLGRWLHYQKEPEADLDGRLPAGMMTYQNGLFNGRRAVRLFSLDVEWKLIGDRVSLASPSFQLESAVEASAFEVHSGTGHLEIVLSCSDLFYAPVLITGAGVHLLLSYARGFKPDKLRSMFPFWDGLQDALSRDREMGFWFEDAVGTILPEKEREKFLYWAGEGAGEVYRSAIVAGLAPSHEAAFFERMRSEGVLGILDDVDLTRALARVSILASAGASAEEVQNYLASTTGKTDIVNEINRRYRAVCGVDVCSIQENGVTSLF